MSVMDLVVLKAYWGNDDAESSIKISAKKWEQIKAGAQFQKTAKSYYEGQKYNVTWSFANRVVSIDGEDGGQYIVELPVQEWIVQCDDLSVQK